MLWRRIWSIFKTELMEYINTSNQAMDNNYKETISRLIKFRDDRDWQQFHDSTGAVKNSIRQYEVINYDADKIFHE